MKALPLATHPRRILLAVTGLSPQIVTETLYALAVGNNEPFVPGKTMGFFLGYALSLDRRR